MLNFEEELKKFQPSLEVDEIEAEAISEDLYRPVGSVKRYLGYNALGKRRDLYGYQRRIALSVPVLV